MKTKIYTYFMKCLKFLVSKVVEVIITLLIMFFLFPALYGKIGWLQAELRILEDAFRSGYIRGTPFKTSQGYWAIEWRLGGQPFIHAVIPYMFMLISIFGGISCLVYLVRRYYSFRRLKKVVTFLRHPKNFRSAISLGVVAMTLAIFLAGLIGTTVDPNIIIHLEPSKDYLEATIRVSLDCYVEVTRFAIVETVTDVIDRNNMTGWFYCKIKTPENTFWNITDINASTILLNGKLHPTSVSFYTGSNGILSLLVAFDKASLIFLLQNSNSPESHIFTLKISGTLKNGDFFAGSTQVKII